MIIFASANAVLLLKAARYSPLITLDMSALATFSFVREAAKLGKFDKALPNSLLDCAEFISSPITMASLTRCLISSLVDSQPVIFPWPSMTPKCRISCLAMRPKATCIKSVSCTQITGDDIISSIAISRALWTSLMGMAIARTISRSDIMPLMSFDECPTKAQS